MLHWKYPSLASQKTRVKRTVYIEQILAFPAKASDRPQTSQSSLSFDELVISDRAMADINQTISRIAYFDSTILIQGESGTGKTALARHIHKNSNRAQKPFVTINCGSIPESLIESELFGYASGAFTSASKKGKPGQVELADGGTLFLDEIGLLPYNLQSKFLQLIQEKTYTPVGALKSKTVNVRIIAATNENLKEFIRQKNSAKTSITVSALLSCSYRPFATEPMLSSLLLISLSVNTMINSTLPKQSHLLLSAC